MTTATVSTQNPVFGFITAWWQKLAYRHKSAEFLMYFMFVTGLLLWDSISINWQVERFVLLTHMFIGLTLFSFIVGAFWSSHRNLLTKSNKTFLRQTGTIIEWLLGLCSLSGFYLFFYGNTGNALGLLIQDVHFYSSWVLAPLVFRHALRWSILKFK
ncbi:hypothetical protein [Pseudoalteromonas denitrificans]|uniref:Uncharacterized protein n=1 Tax=Pseudoalteromonas denitrificans DSM 6059 TaxID=1123010 RepID=A0A1I1Q888_9GAMM|nr:hypothetical protein [Pseudoalteromonas denitrificans]SFD18259.1 hypothetical protein SAMN02745724_03776 [Pseudoalteromonas denitrificans DSM 6059]